MSDERKRIELQMQMLQLQKAKAVAMQAAPAPVVEQPQQPPAEYGTMGNPSLPQQAAHVATAVNRVPFDIIDTPNMVGQAAGWGLDKMGFEDAGKTASTMFPKLSESRFIKPLKDAVTSPFVAAGAAPLTEKLHTATEWGVGAPMAKVQKTSMMPDLLMSGGAVLGDEIGRFFDDGQTGEVVGGVSGFLASLLRGKKGIGKNDAKAVELVSDAIDKTEGANAKLNQAVARQDSGTLADLTEAQSIYNIEAGIAPKGSPMRDDIDRAVAQTDAKLQSDIGSTLPDGSLETSRVAAQQDLQGRLDEVELNRGNEVIQAQAAADAEDALNAAEWTTLEGKGRESQAIADALRADSNAAQEVLNTQPIPSDASKNLAGDLDTIDRFDKRAESRAWSVIDDAGAIDVSQAAKNMDDFSATLKLPPTDAEAIKVAFRPEFDRITSWTKAGVEPKEIQSVLRNMKQKIADNAADGSPDYAHTSAKKMVRYLESQLTDTTVTQGFDGFREAIASTVKRFDRTKAEKVGKARRSPETETLTDRLGYTGKGGAATARLIKKTESPVAIEKSHDVIRAEGKDKGVDEKFIKDHQGYLSAFPEFNAEMQAIANKRTKADAGASANTTNQTQLEKALSEVDKGFEETRKGLTKTREAANIKAGKQVVDSGKGLVADFSRDAEGTINKLLGKAKGEGSLVEGKQLSELHEWAKTKGVEESFKSHVKQQLMNKMFPDDTVGLAKATNATLKTFKQNKQRLVDAGIFTQKQADTLEKEIATIAAQKVKRSRASADPLAPELTAMEERMSMAAAIATVGSTGLPHALILTSFAKGVIQDFMKSQKLPKKAQKKVAEFMLNPEKYQKAHQMLIESKAKGGQLSKERMNDVIRAVISTTAAQD
tara:strand:- start:765 stop:3416 length:2652 start_codon:yes stop_codon:yes gene_type:complete